MSSLAEILIGRVGLFMVIPSGNKKTALPFMRSEAFSSRLATGLAFLPGLHTSTFFSFENQGIPDFLNKK
jgi:hypothetical protein